ncbi:MAG: UbiA family prenyltransferase [Verrucomicrobia bacterium]|nr:UbiA family prenyltransferase [Verrucomicrobiota bacterium]
MPRSHGQLRTFLVLGRVSNLPTVWSNCLAAWLLNGGQSWNNFHVLCIGATSLYIGGMFLNDACDAEFDRQFRKERPIPSGQITLRSVWLGGTTLLLLGWLLMLMLGLSVGLIALLLVGAIILYDVLHKRTVFAPVIMAACRFLLYLVAASATLRSVNDAVVWHGLALAAYITGLSCLAREESGRKIVIPWPLLLLLAPLVVILKFNTFRSEISLAVSVIQLGWLFWCLHGIWNKVFNIAGNGRATQDIGKSVAGLLAGIVLVDCSAVPQMSLQYYLVFAGLFVFALILQRKIPAT